MGLSYERRHTGLLGLHKRPGGGASILSLVRNIDVNTTEVPTVGAAPTLLYTFTVEANTLPTNGSFVDFEISGVFANNANGKTLLFDFDGQEFNACAFPFVGTAASAPRGFKMFAKIARVSATEVVIAASINGGVFGVDSAGAPSVTGGGGLVDARSNQFTVPDLSLNDLDITLTGQGTANGDIVKNLAVVNLVQK